MKYLRNIYFILDLLIVLFVFGVLHFIKFDTFSPNNEYTRLIIYFLILWVLFSIYYKKYQSTIHDSITQSIKNLFWSTTMTLFFITSIVSTTSLISISRQFLVLLTIIPLLIEILIFQTTRVILSKKFIDSEKEEKNQLEFHQSPVNAKYVIVGAIMLFIIYFLMIRLRTGDFILYPWSERILLILFASWLISFSITKKYSLIHSKLIYYQITPFIKSGLIMLLSAAMLYYFFRAETISRFLLFGTILFYTTLELLSFLMFFNSRKGNLKEVDDYNIDHLNIETTKWDIQDVVPNQELGNIALDENLNIRILFDQIRTLDDKDQIVEFLENSLEGVNVNFYSSSIFSTISLENIEILRNNSKTLLLNLHKLNDFRRLNQYFITCHQKITTEGLLIGHVLPLDNTYQRLQNMMPRLIFTMIYPFHFFIYRIIPKIPKINSLYFFLTQGRNRAISKAETYGRLNYCGFKVIHEKLITGKLYFIAQKIKTVSTATNPSYHPIVKLDRVGFNGEIIKIHKFRTMHPYSEFIQKDVYEEYELDSKGKFKDDFRVTTWGKFMRKFWIDELPQIYDWLQGRVNLVGVRAISEQYYNLYPKELQEYRIKFKPGIIPPYYVDLPQSLDEICESEKKYLEQKEKAKILTDIKYGFLALKNIIFKGARSR